MVEKYSLPTTEMREGTPPVFIDKYDGPEPSLTNPRISQMAFDAVFMYQPEFQKCCTN